MERKMHRYHDDTTIQAQYLRARISYDTTLKRQMDEPEETQGRIIDYIGAWSMESFQFATKFYYVASTHRESDLVAFAHICICVLYLHSAPSLSFVTPFHQVPHLLVGHLRPRHRIAMPPSPTSGGPPRALTTQLARAFLHCAQPAAAYGACIRANVETNLAKDVCKQSFDQLRQCIQQAKTKK